MTLGLSLPTFTVIHVVISLAGIFSGLVMAAAWAGRRDAERWTQIFLVTTILTSVTGFMFPFEKLLPSHIVGSISLVVLAITLVAKYVGHTTGAWRWIFAVSSVVALYFNVFVLVVQSFLKIPALKALAPTQQEPPFAVAQLVVLVAFIAIGVVCVRNFRTPSAAIAAAAKTGQ